MVQWDKGQQFILEANEDYYGKQPEIQRAVVLIQEEDARFVAAQAGDVDVALTSATLATTKIPGMRVEEVESVDNRGITLPRYRMRERSRRMDIRSEIISPVM